ncbi:head-tail connector protein [Allorhizobium sp. BGMRC 0089]|uniref:head-tail connector protein n=1 Tax=Allorhizobium sonneratiae TaxID=2934936 RepID=UPI002033398D|nr:head-tail connector protein [Allorhizobium sonneratiae]MCM2291899.1 head-tail connector protein [Allorhizobium sonneratiae]
MTYAELAAPAAEPMTLAEIKAQLKIDTTDEDDFLSGLILAARTFLEAETGLCLITRSLRLYLDDWPSGAVVGLTRFPVQAVTALTVYDEDGNESSISLDGHMLDGQARPARLWLKSRPEPGRPLNGIEIDFTAGFGDAATDVPDTLRRALALHVAAMYAYRGVVRPDEQPAVLPDGYERLIAPYCQRRL